MGFTKGKQVTAKKLSLTKKLAFGFIGASAATIIGTAGVAAAQTSQGAGQMPTDMAACARWADFHFKNRGQCVSWVAHHRNGYGGGGGSNNTVSTNISVDTGGGSNNFIEVVINYFF